jgi:ADP-ribose pyrophosphatase
MAIVFTGRVFSVDVETVQLRNGREHQVETVRHRPSVVLVPMQDPGRLILVRQFRPSVGRELWECPAGGVNEGESAEAAARRECEEEIGRVQPKVQFKE